MSGRGVVGRADVLRVLAGPNADGLPADRLGELCGFGHDGDALEETAREPKVGSGGTSSPGRKTTPVFSEDAPRAVPFLFGAGFTALDADLDREPGPSPRPYQGWRHAPPPPKWTPLAPWHVLEPTLRSLLAPERPTRRVDVREATNRLAKAKPLVRPPLLETPRWPNRLTLVLDRSTHLTPFWRDQDLVAAMLARHVPNCVVETVAFDDRSGAFTSGGDDLSITEVVSLTEEIFVLGDLGALGGGAGASDIWIRVGSMVPKGAARALSPVSEASMDIRLRETWRIAPWVARGGVGAPEDQTEALLRLVSPAVRIEPHYLRQVRLAALPNAGPEIEAMVWRHRDMAIRHEEAGALHPEAAKRRRREFAHLDREQRRAAITAMRDWRGDLDPAVWFEEVLELDADSAALLPHKEDLEDARSYFARQRATSQESGEHHALMRWCDRMGDRAVRLVENEDARALIWMAKEDDPGFAEFDPGRGPRLDAPVGALEVSVAGGALVLDPTGGIFGSPLGLIASKDGLIRIDPAALHPPPLSAFRDPLSGGDEGPEMIAMPLGAFLMGSPEDEEERFSDEGPQHEVAITEPFALARYPVTFEDYDAFCEAEGLEKPDDGGWGRGRRPVINVSWRNAEAYCAWLSAKTGETYRLPSEAEWEYAGRAGTDTRYWWGEEWRDDAANGAGSKSQTTIVGAFPANDWGLFDMAGNVEEWCADHWVDNYEDARTQAAFSSESDEADRVFRGGSWRVSARFCRSASRGRIAPVDRLDFVGFRPARGQVSGAQAVRQEDAERPGFRAGWRETAPPRSGGATGAPEPAPLRRRATPGNAVSIPLTALPPAPFVIRTDRAVLEVQRLTKSDLAPWATAMGRDRHGLWAAFTFKDVRQRLRWCLPGRFKMGSPDDEEGRTEAEGPQTDIVFAEGFWMFDTPVTQELYEAVTGGNPSRFVSPTRPVEQVSFDDAGTFLAALNEQMRGLDLRLPTEAEWEYACRAGTATATYAGAMRIEGANNAPVLTDIAWYGGNSGAEFELETGYDSSPWVEKQIDHKPAGTMPVRLKRPNPWGLHDTLGNVYEWCSDPWRSSQVQAVEENEGDEADRVIRGGSWRDDARSCRSADRVRFAPGVRFDRVGFRPARGQATGAQAGRPDRAERVAPAARKAGAAEPPAAQAKARTLGSRVKTLLGFGKKDD